MKGYNNSLECKALSLFIDHDHMILYINAKKFL